MINQALVNFFHSVYPELEVDAKYIKGYSEDEIRKINCLYDIEIKGHLYDFLLCMGRCSGGLFSDNALMFYRGNKSVRSQMLSQYTFNEDLCALQHYELVRKKPFMFSFENGTQYYFILTTSENSNLVYHYDENEETVELTGLTFNEHLRNLVDTDTRMCIKNMAPNFSGELIMI